MTTAHQCLTRALPSYRAQLTPTARWIPPIWVKLTPDSSPFSRSPSQLSRRQPFTTSPPAMEDTWHHTSSGAKVKLTFSKDQPADLPQRVSPLLQTWSVTPSGKGLRKEFLFKTFNSAWKFMDTVAQECKVQRHHPEWSNLYNRVTIEWTTHRPEGLSVKDVDMALFCDQTAEQIGLKGSDAAAAGASEGKPAQ